MPALGSNASIALFRIYQEALNNAVRHAGATAVAVSLRDERGAVVLTVTDDGVGIENDVAGPLPAALGLLMMRERAAALEGTLTISRGAGGRGTVVTAWLPQPVHESAKRMAGKA
jgi:signal transduction histidine kinase